MRVIAFGWISTVARSVRVGRTAVYSRPTTKRFFDLQQVSSISILRSDKVIRTFPPFHPF